jgi:Spy/CpxP family protein refolding chaperone
MLRQRLLALTLAAMGLFTLSTTAVAQERDRGPASRLLANRQELQLTEEQARRLESMRKQQADLRAELEKSYEQTLAVLTPEQRDKVRQLRRERRAEWREHRHSKWHKREHEREDSTAK